MMAIKTNIISKLNLKNAEAVNDPKQWLHIKSISNQYELTKQYSTIYKKHHVNNKWILIVNPENNSLESMEKYPTKTFTKILKVNSNKVNVKVENIETALRKGNCSAIILNNALFNEKEISQLYMSAKQGKTECIILNNKELIH